MFYNTHWRSGAKTTAYHSFMMGVAEPAIRKTAYFYLKSSSAKIQNLNTILAIKYGMNLYIKLYAKRRKLVGAERAFLLTARKSLNEYRINSPKLDEEEPGHQPLLLLFLQQIPKKGGRIFW